MPNTIYSNAFIWFSGDYISIYFFLHNIKSFIQLAIRCGRSEQEKGIQIYILFASPVLISEVYVIMRVDVSHQPYFHDFDYRWTMWTVSTGHCTYIHISTNGVTNGLYMYRIKKAQPFLKIIIHINALSLFIYNSS